MGIQEALTALPGAFNCSGRRWCRCRSGLLDGLPVGLSLVGRIGADQELLAVAAGGRGRGPVLRPPALSPR
jgi:Asp-tRNA(Asn)/Glu-tRNA(Gln) amidotransferase A subunit family amidase